MNHIENIIEEYILEFGTEEERQMHEFYKGDYQKVFSHKSTNLEEAIEFSGGEIALFSVLVFVLETVGKSLLQDGYKLTKEKLLSYLKKDEKALKKEVKGDEKQLTDEAIKNLIVLLEKELEKKENQEK